MALELASASLAPLCHASWAADHQSGAAVGRSPTFPRSVSHATCQISSPHTAARIAATPAAAHLTREPFCTALRGNDVPRQNAACWLARSAAILPRQWQRDRRQRASSRCPGFGSPLGPVLDEVRSTLAGVVEVGALADHALIQLDLAGRNGTELAITPSLSALTGQTSLSSCKRVTRWPPSWHPAAWWPASVLRLPLSDQRAFAR